MSKSSVDEAEADEIEDETGILQRLAGEIDCIHCLKQFSSTRLPKLLPCNHCLCAKCLENLLQLKKDCPICQHALSAESVEAYPNDRSLLRLADSIPEPGDTPTLCGECFEKAPATCGCIECRSFLCRLHLCTHSCGKLTYSHTTAPAADILVRFQISLGSALCIKHFGVVTCSFCQEDYCMPCGIHQCRNGGSKKKKKKKKPAGSTQPQRQDAKQRKSSGDSETARPVECGSSSAPPSEELQASTGASMALKSTEQLAVELDRKLADNAECPVCLACYKSDGTERLVPRILPCDHLVCSGCLKVLLSNRSQRKCPECRAPLPHQRVSEYSKNFRLLRLLEKSDADADQAGLLCAECVDHRSGGFACLQCEAFLCRLHSCAHRRSRACHAHPIAHSHSLLQNSAAAAGSVCPCRKHFGSALAPCTQCSLSFCTHCAPAGHVECLGSAAAQAQPSALVEAQGLLDALRARRAALRSEPLTGDVDAQVAKVTAVLAVEYAPKFAAQPGEPHVDMSDFEDLDCSKCDLDQIFALQVYVWFASDTPVQLKRGGEIQTLRMQAIPGDTVVKEPLFNYKAGNLKAAEAGLSELIDIMEQYIFYEKAYVFVDPELFPGFKEPDLLPSPHFEPRFLRDDNYVAESFAFCMFFRDLVWRLLDKWHGTVLVHAVRCTLRLRMGNAMGALADARECMRQRPGWVRGMTLLARACEATGCEWGAVAAMQHIAMGNGLACPEQRDEWGRDADQDYAACLDTFLELKYDPTKAAGASHFSRELRASAMGLLKNPPSMLGLPNMQHPDKRFALMMYVQLLNPERAGPHDAPLEVGKTIQVCDRVRGDHLVMCPLMNFMAEDYAAAEHELGVLIANFERFQSDAAQDDFLQKLIEPTMQRLRRFGRAEVMARMVRCVARLELGDGPGALADAKCCVASEPHWIRAICLLSRAYLASGMAQAAALAGLRANMLWKIIDKKAYQSLYLLDPEEDMDYLTQVMEASSKKMFKAKKMINKHSPRPGPPKALAKAAPEGRNMFPEPMIMLSGIEELANPATTNMVPARVTCMLPDATGLDWSGRGARALPAGARRLPKLQRLNINGNLISALHPMPQLTELRMESNALQALPAAITALTSLTLLSMAQNRLASLPDSLPLHLTSLVTLQLASNLLDSLPASFSALTCLSLLDLSKNRLASAPPCLRPLSAMNRLVLAGNPPLIASRLPLPAWLLRRPGVLVEHRVRARRAASDDSEQAESSECSGCIVVPLCREEEGLSISLPPASERVRSLDLSVGAGLEYIPECVATYAALRKLRLSWLTEVVEWPAWLGTLTTLQDLSLECSGLQQLPEAFRGLGGLTALNVSSNRLTELPAWLERCTRLLSLQVEALSRWTRTRGCGCWS